MRIIGIIPARYQSTRFPGKPLADIAGRPMVARVYDRAVQVAELDQVLVATDDARIEAACNELGIPTVMTSTDHRTGTDRVAEVAEREVADLYVNIQGDEPLVNPLSIAAAVTPFLQEDAPAFEVTNLMTPVRRMSDMVDSTVPKVVVNNEGDAVYLSRLPIPFPKDHQDFTYYKQVCVYAFRPEALKRFAQLSSGPSEQAEGIELLRFIENGIRVRMVLVEDDVVAVDTPSDLDLVRRLLAAG